MMWHRIPVPIAAEKDRRDLVALLAAYGLSVRIVFVKETPKSAKKYFIEYKEAVGD